MHRALAPKDPVHLPEVCEDEPPCELPSWCSPPDLALGDANIEIWRMPSGSSAAPEPIILGRRPWVHFGRRQQCKVERQPDVELHTRTASRKQALLLRNFHGQVFLLDMGSSHGTYLGRQKLATKTPKEWKPGVVLFFADANTETFELRPRQLGYPSPTSRLPEAKRVAAPGPTGITGIASMVVGRNFAGARRMMGTQLGEEIAVKPKVVDVVEVTDEKDQKEKDQETDPGNQVQGEKLYPGDWEVPADGLSNIGWKPEAQKDSHLSDQAAEAASRGPPTPAPRIDPVVSSHVGSLAARLEKVMYKCLGPDVIGTLRSKGVRYPCPERPDWQLNLWSGRSRPYDPTQPALVVIKAAVKMSVGLTRQVTLEWLSNLPADSKLLVRFTEAPLELAEPAEAGCWQLDLPLAVSGNTGVVSLSSFQSLPKKLFIRLCSCAPSRSGDVLLGGVFGSTLRPLDIDGDEWELSPSDVTGKLGGAQKPAPVASKGTTRLALASQLQTPLQTKPRGISALPAKCEKERTSADIDAGSVSCVESGTESSERSPVSRVSTELGSEDEDEPKKSADAKAQIPRARQPLLNCRAKPQARTIQGEGRNQAKASKGRSGKEFQEAKGGTTFKNKAKGGTEVKSKVRDKSRSRHVETAGLSKPPASGRRTAPQHAGSKGKTQHSRASHSPKARKRSKILPSDRESAESEGTRSGQEEQLMQLPASQLVARMKAGIIAKRLTSPDFKHGRLRAAYSKALDLLCDEADEN
eukprot:s648_g32.t1